MKTYISKFIAMLACASALLAVGCSDDEEQVENILQDMELNLLPDAVTQEVELPLDEISNYWHVYSPSADTWLTHEVVPGTHSLNVYVDGNTSGGVRNSYIMVRSGHNTQRILVNQDYASTINLSQTNINMRYLAGSATVEILSMDEIENVVLKVETVSGQEGWLTAVLQDNMIQIEGTTNPTAEAREAKVVVSAVRRISRQEVSVEIAVYQGRGGMTPYVFNIPDFSESSVYNVMAGGKQVAQITRELLRKKEQVNAQAVVVYPVNDAGEVELTKGYVAQVLLTSVDLTNTDEKSCNYAAPTGAVHGGDVSFSVADNAISAYADGGLAEPVTRVYMPGDVGMGPEEVPGAVEATVEPLRVVDKRGDEEFSYSVVKIGAQYWMGENLRTARYNKNKDFEAIPTGAKGSEAPYVVVLDNVDALAEESQEVRNKLGLMYCYLSIGGYATFDDAVDDAGKPIEILGAIKDNISPEGWIVPTLDEFETLVAYTTKTPAVLGNLDAVGAGSDNNISGFGARQTYYYNPSSSTPFYKTSFYSVHMTRTRSDRSSLRISHFCMNNTSITPDNAWAVGRAAAIRCMNNGAIKVK